MSWFDDLVPGHQRDLGEHCFSEAEMISFARKFDPQYFHIDPVGAADGPFGGLVASGWHTIATWMKLMVATMQREYAARPPEQRGPASGPSPGFLDLSWPLPVRPGDTIRYNTILTEKIELKTRPNWGLVRSRNEGINQRGDLVLRFTGQGLMPRKPPVG